MTQIGKVRVRNKNKKTEKQKEKEMSQKSTENSARAGGQEGKNGESKEERHKAELRLYLQWG